MRKESITNQLNHIAEKICDEYCKYPSEYDMHDGDEIDRLIDEHCDNCPMGELL